MYIQQQIRRQVGRRESSTIATSAGWFSEIGKALCKGSSLPQPVHALESRRRLEMSRQKVVMHEHLDNPMQDSATLGSVKGLQVSKSLFHGRQV
jgi:hypothetical protein